MHQSAQPNLLDMIDGHDDMQPIADVEYAKEESNFQRFAKFHAANPHVYRLIVKLAKELRRRGFKHFGIAAIFERIRFFYIERNERAVDTTGDPYQLNNTYRAFYARLVMSTEPELAGFFETRRSRYDDEETQR